MFFWNESSKWNENERSTNGFRCLWEPFPLTTWKVLTGTNTAGVKTGWDYVESVCTWVSLKSLIGKTVFFLYKQSAGAHSPRKQTQNYKTVAWKWRGLGLRVDALPFVLPTFWLRLASRHTGLQNIKHEPKVCLAGFLPLSKAHGVHGAWLWTWEPEEQHANRLIPDIVVERRRKKKLYVSDAAAIWKPSSSRCAFFFSCPCGFCSFEDLLGSVFFL